MGKGEVRLRETLRSYDECVEAFCEHDVQSAVNALRKELEDNGEKIGEEFVAESMAFGFMEDYKDENTGWGTYFGPMMVMQREDGQWIESPSIQLVTEAMLKCWADRAIDAKHPILRVRYAGLVWDFSHRVTGKSAAPEMARIVIDGTISIAAGRVHKYEVDVITKLGRALSLALSLNDSKRVAKVRDAIISYEDTIAEDDKRGLCGFAFDLLLEDKRIPLFEGQEEKIISELEARLERVSDTSDKSKLDPFASEATGLRLARYYRKKDKGDDVKRVLQRYGGAFLHLAESAAALVASSWLRKVHSVYLEFGMKAEADQVAIRLREVGKKCKDEMKVISGEVKIPEEDIDKYVEAMVAGGPEVALNRMAYHYVPKRDEIVKEIKRVSKEHPISFLMPAVIQDEKGRAVAQIGSLEDDLDGHVIRQSCQDMAFSALFLGKVIGEVRKRYRIGAKKILAEVYRSPIFDLGKKPLIEAGLKAYFRHDYAVAVHVLIPQIEDAIRNLVEITGGPIYKRGRSGGLFLKTFDEVLRDERVSGSLGEDAVLYLRVLFTDPRGWNLRNSVCHGMSPADSFTPAIADRVLHSMLLLAQLRGRNSQRDNGRAKRRTEN